MKKLNFKLNHPLSILAFLSLLSSQIFAQKITGNVSDATDKAQEFATVMLMKTADSTLAKGAITESDGRFDIENVDAGNYFIQVSIVGFKNFSSKSFVFDGKNDVVLPKIQLATLDKELNAVTVVARKPMIEVKADRTVFNVEGSPSATGLNGLELMRRSPGVQVDKDENVSLRGKSNTRIFINGKPSNVEGKDLAQFLKSLNSADIEAIETIANPGAKFDAAGSGGIINIRLKKNKKLGTNGSVAVGLAQGITPKGNASASLNYRDTKWNLFSNYSYNQGIWRNDLFIDNSSGDTAFVQSGTSSWGNKNHNFKVGADYSVNKFNTFGFLINGGVTTDGFSPTESRTVISRKSRGGAIDSVLLAGNQVTYFNNNMNYNLNYRFADTSGHELNVDVDYGRFVQNGRSNQQNYYKNADETRNLRTNLYRDTTRTVVEIKTGKFDYEQPLSKTSKLGFGAKYSDVKTTNVFNFFNLANDQTRFDSTRSRNFDYTERVAAAYVNYNASFGKKWTMQVGLRLESTKSLGELMAYNSQTNKNVDTSYTNLFPSIAFGYTLNDKNMFNLTFRRSINRPNYQDLNPFENRINELTFEAGNPFLRPQYTNSIELGYTLMQMINITANYSRTTDFFTQVTDRRFEPTSGKQSFYITQRNLATKDEYTFGLGTPLPIKKWWNGYLNLGYNYGIFHADFGEGKTVDLAAGGANIYMQHTFSLGKDWSTEVSGWFSTGGVWGIFQAQPQGVMNLAVQKKFWDGDATLRIGFDDLFKTSKWIAKSVVGDLVTNANGNWEGQQLKVNFSYRFGNKQVQAARQRKTGLDDEKNRVKGKN